MTINAKSPPPASTPRTAPPPSKSAESGGPANAVTEVASYFAVAATAGGSAAVQQARKLVAVAPTLPQTLPTLRRGDEGKAVETLQRALLKLGHDVGEANGRFGRDTERGVKAYQASQGLVKDGVVGALTHAKLQADLSQSTEPTSGPPSTTTAAGSVTAGGNPIAAKATSPTRAVGANVTAATSANLKPVDGKLTGPALFITDNPESFSTPGVLGSTIARTPDRGDGRHTFDGGAQTFSLAQNRTGSPQRFSNVIHNPGTEPMTVKVSGTLYMPTTTKTDGRIPPSYAIDGGFRGPQAIASSSHAKAVPGQNGYFTKTVTVPPGKTVSLTDTYHPPGAEVFSRLTIDAKTAGGQAASFSLAVVSSPKSLAEADFQKLRAGTYAAAGKPENFAPARAEKGELGRPNGVVKEGSIFAGGRTVDVSSSSQTGDMFMATRYKNAGSKAEIGQLSSVLGNLGGTPAAKADEGNYGVSYALRYPLQNNSDVARNVEIRLTAPSTDGKPHHPTGGEMTTALKLNGNVVEARVNQRGEGTVIGTVVVPPHSTHDVTFDLTNFGNNFPPAGIEFVVN
jgi:peptidoglycan hydrolase-like protein with peptidoglycan-binding domain